jgi:hypothetical protein
MSYQDYQDLMEGAQGGGLLPSIINEAAPIFPGVSSAPDSGVVDTEVIPQMHATGGSVGDIGGNTGGILGGIGQRISKALFGDALGAEENKIKEEELTKRAHENLNAQLRMLGVPNPESFDLKTKQQMLKEQAMKMIAPQTPKSQMDIQKDELDIEKKQLDIEKLQRDMNNPNLIKTGDYLYNPQTKEFIAPPNVGEKEPPSASDYTTWMGQYSSEIGDKKIREKVSAAESLFGLYDEVKAGNKSAQVGFVTAVVKVYDPTSIVSESEMGLQVNAKKLPSVFLPFIQAANQGTLFGDAADELMDAAQSYAAEAFMEGETINEKYRNLTSEFDIDATKFEDNFSYDRMAKRLSKYGLRAPTSMQDKFLVNPTPEEAQKIPMGGVFYKDGKKWKRNGQDDFTEVE